MSINGTINISAASALPPKLTRYLTGSGTHTFDPAAIWYEIQLQGGGGGGGGASPTTFQRFLSGEGGSGGHYLKYRVQKAFYAAGTATYGVGGGGLGGTSGAPSANAGAGTTFQSLNTAPGGLGGLGTSNSSNNDGGNFRVNTTGQTAVNLGNNAALVEAVAGEYGDPGWGIGSVINGSVFQTLLGGRGGSARLGLGARQVSSAQTAQPTGSAQGSGAVAAQGYGGGGGGGICRNNALGASGGNGAGGCIIITEFYQ